MVDLLNHSGQVDLSVLINNFVPTQTNQGTVVDLLNHSGQADLSALINNFVSSQTNQGTVVVL